MATIKDAIGTKLINVLGSTSVFQNFIPRDEANNWIGVPAAVFRQISAERGEYGDEGLSLITQEKFLVETFSYSQAEAEEWKQKIERAFIGPVSGIDDEPGVPVKWIEDGPLIYGACAKEPNSDAEFAAYEHHEALNFEQLTLDITYVREIC